jgi:hypothetical protein
VKSHQRLQDNAGFAKDPADPFLQEAMRVFPGLNASDRLVVAGLGTPLSLADAAAGIKALYGQMLDRAWADARRRGDKLPAPSQRDIAPEVVGQQ